MATAEKQAATQTLGERMSRTGTGTWKTMRNRVLKEALDQGLMHCPRCRIGLDWEYSKRPNSPEVDHIVASALGGTDTRENLRVICRSCNQSLGGQLNKRRPRPVITTTALETSDTW